MDTSMDLLSAGQPVWHRHANLPLTQDGQSESFRFGAAGYTLVPPPPFPLMWRQVPRRTGRASVEVLEEQIQDACLLAHEFNKAALQATSLGDVQHLHQGWDQALQQQQGLENELALFAGTGLDLARAWALMAELEMALQGFEHALAYARRKFA